MIRQGQEMMPNSPTQVLDKKQEVIIVAKDASGNVLATINKTRNGGTTRVRFRNAAGERMTSIPITDKSGKVHQIPLDESVSSARAFMQQLIDDGAIIEEQE